MKCFLSHSSKDKDRYVRIVADKIGLENCHYDELTFEEGRSNLDLILRGLSETELFVIFLSEDALKSSWVKKELSAASELFEKSQLNRVYPIIIDEKLKYDDERIPEWLKGYNLRFTPKPTHAAKRIRQHLIELSWEKYPKLKERDNIYIGRFDQLKDLQQRLNDYNRERPLCVVVSGIPHIGRKAFIKKSLIDNNVVRNSYQIFKIVMSGEESLEDFIRKIHDAGYNSDESKVQNLINKSLDEKFEIAKDLLLEFFNYNKCLIIEDNYALVNGDRVFTEWFKDFIVKFNELEYDKDCLICISSRYKVEHYKYCDLVYSIKIPDLTPPDRQALLSKYLALENINDLSKADFDELLLQLTGLPEQVFYSVTMLKDIGLKQLKKRYDEIQKFNSQKAIITLQKFEDDADAIEILAVLAEEEVFEVSFLYDIFNSKSQHAKIEEFLAMGICDYFLDGNGFIRLNDVIRDYVTRNKYRMKISQKYKDELKLKVEKFFNKAEYADTDISSVGYLIKAALKNGKKIDDQYLLPSHYLQTMQELYHASKYQKLVDFADKLLEKHQTLTKETISSARIYLCQALARLREDRFKVEVMKVPSPEHDFLFGFYYRYCGLHDRALRKFENCLTHPKTSTRTKREMVQVYINLEEFDKALQLAEESYLSNPYNHFYVQAYFNCLMNSDPISNYDKLKELLEKFEVITVEQAQEMSLIAQAQFAAKCDRDFKLAEDLLIDAEELNPESRYMQIERVKLFLTMKDYPRAEATIKHLTETIGERALPRETMTIFEAEILANKGKVAEATIRLETRLSHFPEQSLNKLIARICGNNSPS